MNVTQAPTGLVFSMVSYQHKLHISGVLVRVVRTHDVGFFWCVSFVLEIETIIQGSFNLLICFFYLWYERKYCIKAVYVIDIYLWFIQFILPIEWQLSIVQSYGKNGASKDSIVFFNVKRLLLTLLWVLYRYTNTQKLTRVLFTSNLVKSPIHNFMISWFAIISKAYYKKCVILKMWKTQRFSNRHIKFIILLKQTICVFF